MCLGQALKIIIIINLRKNILILGLDLFLLFEVKGGLDSGKKF